MINASNAFKQGLENGEKVWIEVDITFSDGTSKHLKNEIMNGNNSFSDCAESSSFPIGCVICKSMTFELDNTSDQWKDYYFYMAKVHAYLKMQIDADTIETIDKGVYTITTPEQYGEILNLTALDDMYKTNAAHSTKLVLPQTIESLVRDACGTLGITAGFSKMAHGDLIINELPKDMTYRQLFGWAAMLDTANARLDNNGSLQFVGWNLDAAPSIELKNYINMPTISSDDIVITGINIISGDNSETYGTSGYILSMENNLVGESDLATVAAQIGDSIIGAKFRNLQGDMAFNPLLEFGDVAYTYDRNLNQYVTPLTDVSYTINGKTTLKTQADDPIRGMSLYYSGATKAIVAARRLVEKEKNARELAIEKLQESLSVGSGLFATYVQQEDGSTISYFHDKGTLEESKNVIKITSEAIGVSNDGGKTYPFGFQLTGTMITKLLYAEGINADYIDSGALTVRDKNGNIIFQVNMDTNTVYMNPDILIIGNQTLTEKLTAMDNSIAETKSMTMQLTNDYQNIATDADGNITGTFPTVTTTAQVMYGTNDVTNDCTYTITKSNNVTGSWDDSTHTYTVTGLSSDNGWVDIKATYLRALSITKRFAVAKLKAGKNGVNGLDGLQGERGEQGVPGKDGKDGTNGVDGKTSYFHIKYSSVANPTSSSQMTETPSTYIGTYVDYEPNDSTDPKKYTWSKFEGSDGKDGIPGTNGTDGKTYYLHIAYANSADGKTGFSVSDGTNKLYIGQYTDTVKEDSTDPTKYTWSKIKGDPGTDGKPGRTYIIEPSCSVLKRSADNTISPNFLEFNAYYRDGDSATRYTYNGRFVIEETADGNTWTTIYRSTVDESTVKHYLYTILTDSSGQTVTDGNGTTVGIPRDITNIRCKLYSSGGTTTLMDMQSVAVVIDVDNLTQSQIVEILSNDGAWKGLYYKNGQLYISFSAALGGELTLGGANNGNGKLIVRDTNGNQIGKWDNTGANLTGTLKTMLSSSYQGVYIKIDAQNIEVIDTELNNGEPILSLSGTPLIGDTTYTGQGKINIGSNCEFYIGGNSWAMLQMYPDDDHTTKIMGNFEVIYGTKSRVAETKSFSDRLLYCYETPTPLFGDLGCGRTNDKGIAIIDIDPIFAETVSADAEYQVFLQKEGSGDIWVEEKEQEYFVVKGTPNLKFSWEIKCMQKGFEHLRLNEESQIPTVSKDITNYEIDSENIINTTLYDYDKEMEELINESS